MKVVVAGGTGLLGRALAEEWRSDELILTGSRELDVRERAQMDGFIARHRPDWVVLAAAYTDVDGCERDAALADEVNHRGAVNVGRICKERGIRLLFISTDFVFDGSKSTPYEPDDPVCPINVYGQSKAAAEADLRALLPQCCIVRTSWIFGAEKRCFPNTLLERCATRKEFPVIADQRGCPNYNHDLAQAIAELVHEEAQGIVHLTNGAGASWFEFAQELVRVAGLRDITVRPTTMAELNRPARRPPYSVLSDASLRAYGIRLRHWREAIPDYLARQSDISVSIRHTQRAT